MGHVADSKVPSLDADDGVCALLELVLRLLGCNRAVSSEGGSVPLKCFYDLPPEIVERQLEFRRTRKMARDSSHNSLAALGIVMDFLGRRIEVDFDRTQHRGTISSFEEDMHLVSFDDETQRWFHLDFDPLTDSGHVQPMLRDEDGAFGSQGCRLKSRLV